MGAHHAKLNPACNSGVSIISVLTAIAIIGVTIVVAMNATSERLKTIWKIRDTDSISELEEYVRERVEDTIGDYVEESLCGRDAFFNDVAWAVPGAAYNVTWLKPAEVTSKLAFASGSSQQAAKDRCQSDQTFSSGTESVLNSKNIYFCLFLEPTSSSILKGRPAFAEFSVNFVDFETGDSKDCTDLLDPDDGIEAVYARGMVSTYTLYWRGGPTTAMNFMSTNDVMHTKMHD